MFIVSECDTLLFDHPNLNFYQCVYDTDKYSPALYSHLGIEFPKQLSQAVYKRQASFLAGRYSAKQAMLRLGSSSQVYMGVNRNPIWPESINGSISHTGDTALCVTANKKTTPLIGIDVENIVSASTASNIQKSIINDFERSLLQSYFNHIEIAFTLAFSAKESLFKTLYPALNCFFDFTVAEIQEISIRDQKLVIRIVTDINNLKTSGLEFDCYFKIYEQKIFTLVSYPHTLEITQLVKGALHH